VDEHVTGFDDILWEAHQNSKIVALIKEGTFFIIICEIFSNIT
jgi:hypothetical protein